MKLLIFILFISSSAIAAEPSAGDLFAAGKWDEAATAYAREAQADPDDGRAWLRLAVSARQSDQLETASAALRQAERLQFAPIRVALETARLQVVGGHNAAAIVTLQGVAEQGFTAVDVLSADPVLKGLAGTPEFDALVAEMSVKAFPCEHDEQFNEFDFWIGAWDVHDGSGAHLGSNIIERAQRGCLLIENWTSARGGTGTSINYVDRTAGEWVQIWNDASGGQIHIRGGLGDDGMLLTGTIHYIANGTTASFRGLWAPLPDGRVRQFFEQSNDGGDTWSTWFEGFYSPRSSD
jgi:hypothetical protein